MLMITTLRRDTFKPISTEETGVWKPICDIDPVNVYDKLFRTRKTRYGRESEQYSNRVVSPEIARTYCIRYVCRFILKHRYYGQIFLFIFMGRRVDFVILWPIIILYYVNDIMYKIRFKNGTKNSN